jgi:hypothetical protein
MLMSIDPGDSRKEDVRRGSIEWYDHKSSELLPEDDDYRLGFGLFFFLVVAAVVYLAMKS